MPNYNGTGIFYNGVRIMYQTSERRHTMREEAKDLVAGLLFVAAVALEIMAAVIWTRM